METNSRYHNFLYKAILVHIFYNLKLTNTNVAPHIEELVFEHDLEINNPNRNFYSIVSHIITTIICGFLYIFTSKDYYTKKTQDVWTRITVYLPQTTLLTINHPNKLNCISVTPVTQNSMKICSNVTYLTTDIFKTMSVLDANTTLSKLVHVIWVVFFLFISNVIYVLYLTQ